MLFSQSDSHVIRSRFFLLGLYLPKLCVITSLHIFFRMFGQHQTLDQQDLSTAHQPQTLDLYTDLHHLKAQFSDRPAKVRVVLFEYSVFTNKPLFCG